MIVVVEDTTREVEVGQEMTIGRAYSNLLRLEGEDISRVHAIIYRRANEYVLRDLDSKNGVYLNGQKVTNAILSNNDEIQIGTYTMVFDPPAEFNADAFLRRHRGRTPEPQQAIVKNDQPELKTFFGKDKSVWKQDADTDVVFYPLEDLERMVTESTGGLSQAFALDILRMQNSIAEQPSPDETEGERSIYAAVIQTACEVLRAERGVVILRDDASEVMRLGAMTPLDKDVSVNRTVLNAVLRDGMAVLCNDVAADTRFHKTDTVRRERIGSLIAVPMALSDGASGLLYCDVLDKSNAFRRDHLLLLLLLSKQATFCLRFAATRRAAARNAR
jgi:hypothetical protein